MGLLEPILRPIRAIRQTFDPEQGPATLASQWLQLKQQVAELQNQFAEALRLSKQKDDLIAELHALSCEQSKAPRQNARQKAGSAGRPMLRKRRIGDKGRQAVSTSICLGVDEGQNDSKVEWKEGVEYA